MRYCPSCGREVGGWRFCMYCGYQLAPHYLGKAPPPCPVDPHQLPGASRQGAAGTKRERGYLSARFKASTAVLLGMAGSVFMGVTAASTLLPWVRMNTIAGTTLNGLQTQGVYALAISSAALLGMAAGAFLRRRWPFAVAFPSCIAAASLLAAEVVKVLTRPGMPPNSIRYGLITGTAASLLGVVVCVFALSLRKPPVSR